MNLSCKHGPDLEHLRDT